MVQELRLLVTTVEDRKLQARLRVALGAGAAPGPVGHLALRDVDVSGLETVLQVRARVQVIFLSGSNSVPCPVLVLILLCACLCVC